MHGITKSTILKLMVLCFITLTTSLSYAENSAGCMGCHQNESSALIDDESMDAITTEQPASPEAAHANDQHHT